jgi:dienelactone hydrolase
VLVLGSGPNDRDESVGGAKVFRDLAQGLASRGVAVLSYEKRTKQFGAKIASDHAPMTINEEVVDDAVAALALLRKTDRLDRSRMFVIGHSLGAMMAPEIARRDPSLAGIIAMAGPTRPIQVLLREQTAYILEKTGAPEQVRRDKLAELDAELAKIPSSKTAAGAAGAKGAAGIAGGTSATGEAGAANAAGAAGAGGPAGADGAGAWVLGASPEYWVSLQAYDPVATAKKIRTPLLIIQGERDYQVTMKDLDGWKAALAGKPGVDIRSYPKLNHLFVAGDGPSLPGEYDQPGHVAESVVADVAVWIKKQPPARLS